MTPETEQHPAEVETRLLEAIDNVGEWVQASGNFVSDQAPLLAQEVVNYQFYLSICVGSVLAIALAFLSMLLWRASCSTEYEDNAAAFPIALVAFACGFALLLCVTELVEAYAAPRKVVVDYFLDLTKSR